MSNISATESMNYINLILEENRACVPKTEKEDNKSLVTFIHGKPVSYIKELYEKYKNNMKILLDLTYYDDLGIFHSEGADPYLIKIAEIQRELKELVSYMQ